LDSSDFLKEGLADAWNPVLWNRLSQGDVQNAEMKTVVSRVRLSVPADATVGTLIRFQLPGTAKFFEVAVPEGTVAGGFLDVQVHPTSPPHRQSNRRQATPMMSIHAHAHVHVHVHVVATPPLVR
tara:strand:- start:87 stop:461 length:375 start_codon:yes stop_codon:yes gene_type:complete